MKVRAYATLNKGKWVSTNWPRGRQDEEDMEETLQRALSFMTNGDTLHEIYLSEPIARLDLP